MKPDYVVKTAYNKNGIFLLCGAALLLLIALFSGEMGHPMVFLTIGVLAFLGLLRLRVSVYEANCPYCGVAVQYPVKAEGMDCPACKRRMMLKDGRIQQI